jgi:hypothetical protein
MFLRGWAYVHTLVRHQDAFKMFSSGLGYIWDIFGGSGCAHSFLWAGGIVEGPFGVLLMFWGMF